LLTTYIQNKKFFDLPLAVKKLVSFPPDGDKHFEGWTGVGDAFSSQGIWDAEELEKKRKETPTELKECLEMRDPCGAYSGGTDLKNVEKHLPGFLDFVKKWFTACFKQSLENMRLVCEILGFEDLDYFGKMFQPRELCTHTSWNYFLSQPLSELTMGSVNRLNTHTDYGQFTMLFQDMVGGLELYDYEDKIYRPVPPIKGSMILQIGDLLEKQTNGRWISALHRVRAPSRDMAAKSQVSSEELVRRQSLVFFGWLNPEKMVEVLPGCEKPGKWSTFEWKDKMKAGEWISRRVALEYCSKSIYEGIKA
jgi:isopenicillin N synthase-like dioxygenase